MEAKYKGLKRQSEVADGLMHGNGINVLIAPNLGLYLRSCHGLFLANYNLELDHLYVLDVGMTASLKDKKTIKKENCFLERIDSFFFI